MHEIYKAKEGGSVSIGDDSDYEKIKDNPSFLACRMCKEGPGGHRQTLGYHSLGAPKNKNYLYIEQKDHLAVNILDLDDPNMIPWECLDVAVRYIRRKLAQGKHILVACNQGKSRGPSTGLAFLKSIGEMPYHFQKAESVFKTLYPKYDPGMGIRQVMKEHWDELGDKDENK